MIADDVPQRRRGNDTAQRASRRAARRAARQAVRGRRIGLTLLMISLLGTFGGLGSRAAWTVTDANAGNTFTTSTILLSDNQGGEGGSATHAGTAMFNVTDLSPGSAATTRCIQVDISGTASASTLTLTGALGGADAGLLGPLLTMDVAEYDTSGADTVTPGSNTNNGSCAGYPGGHTTVGAQGDTLTGWTSSGPYSIASPVTRTWYRFTVSGLPPASTSCATYCGKTVTLALTWTLTTT